MLFIVPICMYLYGCGDKKRPKQALFRQNVKKNTLFCYSTEVNQTLICYQDFSMLFWYGSRSRKHNDLVPTDLDPGPHFWFLFRKNFSYLSNVLMQNQTRKIMTKMPLDLETKKPRHPNVHVVRFLFYPSLLLPYKNLYLFRMLPIFKHSTLSAL